MSLFTINASRSGSSPGGTFLLNYGGPNTAYDQQYFLMPFDGYIKYISIGTNLPQPANQPFTLINEDTLTTYNGIITLPANNKEVFQSYGPTVIPFNGGERFRFQNDIEFTGSAINVTFWVEIPAFINNTLSVVGSMSPTLDFGTQFIALNTPYSFGSDVLSTPGFGFSMGFSMPDLDATLIGGAMSASEALSPTSIPVTVNVLKNQVSIGSPLSLGAGTFSTTQTYSELFNSGDKVELSVGTTNTNINSSTVVLFFETSQAP